jgi:hypothetical protein
MPGLSSAKENLNDPAQSPDRTNAVRRSQYIRFAYRRFGKSGGVPLVFNMHFTGTMDH